MNSHVRTNFRPSLFIVLMCAMVVAATNGCTTIIDDMVAKDVRALDHEFMVSQADLAQFRQCLQHRGGMCEGNDTTALPHSSQSMAGQSVEPVPPGTSQTLIDSVAKLPGNHPARSAHEVLSHPVVAQATSLHNLLRGHNTAAVPGFSVKKSNGVHGTAQSTATMTLGLGHVQHLHTGLLSTLGTTAWESLHGHCASLLKTHANATDLPHLKADCRRVGFIRGYLKAYTRAGEFVEVDVGLAGAIKAVNDGAAKINHDIDRLRGDLQALETDVDKEDRKFQKQIDANLTALSGKINNLVSQVGDDLTKRYGASVGGLFDHLGELQTNIDTKSAALAQAAAKGLDRDVKKLAADLQKILGRVSADLHQIEDKVATADHKVVQAINTEVAKTDATLSNIFKVSHVGFVSRDHTFRGRLPTLEVSVDPTVRQLVKVTDVDTSQVLHGSTSVTSLGVYTDHSGVGTGGRIGAEIVRVFLEAIFDAHEGLPAVAPANQPGVKPTGLLLGDYSLPLFTTPMGHVDSRDLTRMTNTNDRVAANTKVIMGRVISGIGPFSLNNEPLEEFIVEIVTTSVRKATAKATWCWYACNLDSDLHALEGDVKTTVKDAAKQIDDKVKATLKKDAEQVKLRFKLGK